MLPALFLYASLVNDVRSLIARHDEAAAERAAREYQARSGATPELAAALSWLARAALSGKRFDAAQSLAAETRTISLDLLRTRKLDADSYLPVALGASIEVHAQVLGAMGERAEAVRFLRDQMAAFGSTSLRERIQKNINLLTLEGKPAPPLEESDWLGPRPPPLASLRGRPVLLFFWAHWCPDCKAEAAALAHLRDAFAPQGLALIGPTKLYGYVAGGEDASPAVEKPYIDGVRSRYYSVLGDMPVPLSAANFAAYGASTTPTLVLLDAEGIVRYYHPGVVPEAELARQIRSILKK